MHGGSRGPGSGVPSVWNKRPTLSLPPSTKQIKLLPMGTHSFTLHCNLTYAMRELTERSAPHLRPSKTREGWCPLLPASSLFCHQQLQQRGFGHLEQGEVRGKAQWSRVGPGPKNLSTHIPETTRDSPCETLRNDCGWHTNKAQILAIQ